MATGRIPTTANSPLTAKGDLFTFSTGSAKLAVGNNGETLVADSSTSTGLRYQGLFGANKNKIINGDFGIWQRGTSVAVPANNVQTFQADRFWAQHNGTTNGTVTYARQAFTVGQTDVPYNPSYFARVTNTTLGTSQTQTEFGQSIEDVSTFASQTATFSFYVKASGTFTISGFAWQNFGSGGSTSVFTSLTFSTSTTTTSWQRVTATLTVPSILGKTVGTGNYISFYVRMASPTAGSTIDFSNWQVEAGSVATAFQTATGTLQGELAACQRYYFKLPGSNNIFYAGFNNSTTEAYSAIPLPVTMRARPTTTVTSAASNLAVRISGGTNVASNGTTSIIGNTLQNIWFSTTVASGLTAGQGSALINLGSAEAIEMSAEL